MLSDPQERAWYDSHRDAILHDDEESTGGHFEHNVRITTTEDVIKMLAKVNGRMEYSDAAAGFFSTLQSFFDTLAHEESIACDWQGIRSEVYPSFGSSKDNYEQSVRPFYATWSSFATKKSFSWKDIYRYSDAPDRRVRRMMEKKNNRSREEGIREFNEAVRSLVAFTKKRDPRFIPNAQTEADRQKVLKDAVASQAARSRALNNARLAAQVVPEWTKARAEEDLYASEEEEEEEKTIEEHFECVACSKMFKSEQQFASHERSKKHQKAVQYLRRLMKKDNRALNIDENSSNEFNSSAQEEAHQEGSPSKAQDSLVMEDSFPPDVALSSVIPPSHPCGEKISLAGESEHHETDDTSNDEYAPRGIAELRLTGGDPQDSAPSSDVLPSPVSENVDEILDSLSSNKLAEEADKTPKPKLGKAKEKRAKKAAQQSKFEALNHGVSASLHRVSSNHYSKSYSRSLNVSFAGKYSRRRQSFFLISKT